MVRVCFITCAVAACGLAGWAAFLAFRSTAPDTSGEWIIEEPDRDLGTVPLGTHPLSFRIRNWASSDRRIIGVAEG